MRALKLVALAVVAASLTGCAVYGPPPPRPVAYYPAPAPAPYYVAPAPYYGPTVGVSMYGGRGYGYRYGYGRRWR